MCTFDKVTLMYMALFWAPSCKLNQIEMRKLKLRWIVIVKSWFCIQVYRDGWNYGCVVNIKTINLSKWRHQHEKIVKEKIADNCWHSSSLVVKSDTHLHLTICAYFPHILCAFCMLFQCTVRTKLAISIAESSKIIQFYPHFVPKARCVVFCI